MTTTLTIRLDEKAKKALEERAKLRRTTISALLREIVDDAVTEKPLGERIGHLAGRLGPAQGEPDEWERHLRETNWRS